MVSLDSDYFILHEVFQYFLGSQNESQGRVWHQVKFISFYALLSKENA